MTLDQVPVGKTVTIEHIHCDDAFFRRICAMGVRTGSQVTVIRQAPWNGPIHIRAGTTDLCLRRELANHIKVL